MGAKTLAQTYHIDMAAFTADPYPDLTRMQAEAGVVHVPELGATLLTRHADITREEKNTAVFSSVQPGGLMNVLMGENMMRKDGEAHLSERKALFPTFSPRTARQVWMEAFQAHAHTLLDTLTPKGEADLVADYALPVSALCLMTVTGLTCASPKEFDAWSQGMMDGIANYAGLPEPEARCKAATAAIDAAIDRMTPQKLAAPDKSLLSVALGAGMAETSLRANMKLAISGGQNEPRDAISGAAYALLSSPDQRRLVEGGEADWNGVFDEYVRWVSPIGMSPRRIAAPHELHGVSLEPESRAFLMFSAANRDPEVFDRPEVFDLTRDSSKHIAFGAGPHFCAGAAASRTMVAGVALPLLFERLKGLRLAPGADPAFTGWAFRGLTSLPVVWDV